MNFYIADPHFDHNNIIKLCNRPFKDITHMNDTIIARWNSVVKSFDHVYVLGDFAWKAETFKRIVPKLNGTIHFIPGNHDMQALRQLRRDGFFKDSRFLLHNDIHQVREGENPDDAIILCHYPMLEWGGYFRGSYHFFGHTHGNLKHSDERAIDASVDVNGYIPRTFKELIVK